MKKRKHLITKAQALKLTKLYINRKVDPISWRKFYKKLGVSRQYAYLISTRRDPWVRTWLGEI